MSGALAGGFLPQSPRNTDSRERRLQDVTLLLPCLTAARNANNAQLKRNTGENFRGISQKVVVSKVTHHFWGKEKRY